jgi:hypothetical protein
MPTYIADTVYIYQSELKLISEYVLQNPETETGGDLFGNWTHQSCPVAQVAIGPGPHYDADRAHFYQDVEFLKEQGRYWSKKHALHHIGQWHSHHKLGLEEPSTHDDATIYNAIHKYGLNEFLLIIATLQKEVRLKAFIYRSNNKRYGLRWSVLESKNPYKPDEYYDVEAPACIDVEVDRKTIELALNDEASWLNTEMGRKWLRSVHESLKSQCNNVSMYMDAKKQIIIACEKHRRTFEFVIPEQYPQYQSYWRDIEAKSIFTIPHHG